jgi:hypothetical protein
VVTTEVGFCSFCGRPRNLRHEAHQLGTLVRTIVTCETCHRTLSSTVGIATAEPAAADSIAEVAAAPSAVEPAAELAVKPAPQRKTRAAAKTTASKSGARKKGS